MSRITAFCLGVMGVFAIPAQMSVIAWVGLIVAILSVMGCCVYRREYRLLGWLLAMVLGASYAYGRTAYALSQQWGVSAQTSTFHIQVVGLPEYHDKYTRFIAQAQHPNGQIYRLQLQDYAKRIWQTGEHWQIQARVRAAIGTRNQAGFDREAWALANGIDGMGSVGKQRFRLPETSWAGFHGIRARIVQQWRDIAHIYPQGSALMKALSVGDDSGLSAEAWAAFRPLGLNHLISISGLHITMVGVLFVLMSRWLFRVSVMPRRPKVGSLAIGWTAAAMYTLLAGAEIPALRSLLMLTVFAWAWTWRQHWGSWRIFWTAMAVVLLYQPMAVLSVGFALSFGLVATLLWAMAFRLPETGQHTFWQHRFIQIKQTIKAQWAVSLISGVASVYLFGLLPIFSPIVNAVAIPFFSIVLTPLALLSSALPIDGLKYLAAYWGEHTILLLIWLGNRLPESAFPQANVYLVLLGLLGGLGILLPVNWRMRGLLALGCVPLLFYQPRAISGSLKATVYDVGQGLAVLIQTPNYQLLYDTGTPAAEFALLPNLRAAGVRQLDGVVLSHHDDDHDGGFPALQKQYSIKQLYAGQPEFYPHAQACQSGHRWQQDGVLFEFLTLPAHLYLSSKDNDLSCVLRVSTPQGAILLTGDIGQVVESQLIEYYAEKLKSDVLILAHHGSQSSNSMAFLRAVSPKVAVASSGFANAYRHPSPKVQQRLAALHIQLLRTDWQGGLAFDFGEQGVRYSLLAPSPKWWQRKPFF